MIDPKQDIPEEFAPTREHEYQDSHYHDEEPDIVNDELGEATTRPALAKTNRRPPPRPHYFEE